jgi:hypothetical protein
MYYYTGLYTQLYIHVLCLDLFLAGASTWASADRSDQHHATVDDPATRLITMGFT